MSAQAEDDRFTLTDEDGDRLVVRPPTLVFDLWRIKMTTAAGDARVFASTEEMRALRDHLNTLLP